MSASEKLLADEKILADKFNELITDNPSKAQAIAVLGIYHAVNTIARTLDHLTSHEFIGPI